MSEWISTKNRLPSDSIDDIRVKYPDDLPELIVMIDGASLATTLYWDGEHFVDDCNNWYNVTHWMTMPEPPEEETA